MQVYQMIGCYMTESYKRFKMKQNFKKMEHLKSSLQMLDQKYQKYYKVQVEIEKHLHQLQEKMNSYQQQYEKYQNKNTLYQYSNQIQMLEESIQKLNEKMIFASQMELCKSRHKKIYQVALWNNWYQFEKQQSQEEQEKIYFVPKLISFCKLYRSVMKKQKRISHINQGTIIEFYQKIKENLIVEKEKKLVYLEERRNFIANDRKRKNEFLNQKQELEKQYDFIKNNIVLLAREKLQMQKEVQILQVLNQQYFINQPFPELPRIEKQYSKIRAS